MLNSYFCTSISVKLVTPILQCSPASVGLTQARPNQLLQSFVLGNLVTMHNKLFFSFSTCYCVNLCMHPVSSFRKLLSYCIG